MIPLNVFLPIPLGGSGVSYTCGKIAEGIAGDRLAVKIVTPRVNRRHVPSVEVVEVLPPCARYMPYSWVRSFGARKIETAFVSEVLRDRSPASVAYIWPDAKAETIRSLKRHNALVVREMVNCPRQTAKMILDDAYERFRVLPQHAITSESVVAETEGLELADYIFCPSPIVHSSLIKLGMPPSKLLLTSYGWDPIRLSRSTTQLPRADGLNALFVGTLNVRKGVHLLLHYWAQSGIKGKLTLAGEMDPIIKEKCADLLNRDDVVVRDFADDVGALYRSADVFLIPSLEEGSPLVTYEACGSRLPVVASPMGGGGIVRDKLEGLIIDPYDGPAWVAAIRTLAYDSELRMQMGQAAAKRAENFVWSSVTARRRDQIINLVKQRIEREESGLYMDLS